MSVLEHLQPYNVFRYFEELCAIPHGSGNTKAISDYLVAFAAARGLACRQDAANNVIIRKRGSAGYEDAATVILQGHMDMVCETDCGRDLLHEGLSLAVDGDMIYAEGSTLGGDDGIAVAMALAILDDDSLPHPPLECVFTVDEETGMLGATALETDDIKGRIMLNLDSEDEGVFTVGCAGGITATCVLPVKREAFTDHALTVSVGGLRGGHSGAEIHKGRANADMLMGRVLQAIASRCEVRLVSVCGGLKDNAIPRECVAEVLVSDALAAREACAELEAILRNEYAGTDPEITVTAAAGQGGAAMDKTATDRAVCMLCCLPNGIYAMSADIEGLVQTSLNLGILTTDEGSMRAAFLVRSSIDSQKYMLCRQMECLMAQLGGRVEYFGDHPGWQYAQVSPLRELMTAVFTEQYGYAPKIEAIHAGVECGIFCGKLPGLDCVSFGPDLKDIHTTRERMSISSVQRVWQMTLEVLKRLK